MSNIDNLAAWAGGPPDDDPYGDSEHAGITWKPVDLGPYLRGEVERPRPAIGVARQDGLRLIYAGKEHSIIGEMESGKSWLAVASAAAELVLGNHVTYIHFEEADPSDTIERLQALHVPDDAISERFRFVGPNEPVDPYALAALLDPPPTLVVLDGVNEAMSLHGWKIMEPAGYADYRRHLVRPCIAVGAAVVNLDHVVKDRERRGRAALGSIHKGNGITGSLIMLENAAPFGRGERGASHVFVTKDRPGWLRRHGRPTTMPGKTYVGTLIVDAVYGDVDQLELLFTEPKDRDDEQQTSPQGGADEQTILQAVADIADAGLDPSLRRIRAKSGMGKDRVDNALERLVLTGKLSEHEGPRRARVFTIPDTSSSSSETDQ